MDDIMLYKQFFFFSLCTMLVITYFFSSFHLFFFVPISLRFNSVHRCVVLLIFFFFFCTYKNLLHKTQCFSLSISFYLLKKVKKKK